MKTSSAIFLLLVASAVAAQKCSRKKTSSKLFCYYSKITDVDACHCTHVILPTDSDAKSIDRVREKINGVKLLLTVTEFNEGLVNVLKNSKVDGLEIKLSKLDTKNDVADFISTIKSKLGADLFIALSVPAKAEILVKYYDLKALTKHADLFILQTAFLGASQNVTFHPSRLSGLWDMQNTDSVVDLISGLGAPLSKLVITAPVQGFQFTLQDRKHTAPGSPALKINSLNRDELCGIMNNGNWTLERDQDQAGPYIFRDNQWIAYEDNMSMDIKAKYTRVRGLAGLALKDLSQDGGVKCGGRLLEAAHEGLSKQSRAPRGAVLHSLEREILESPARPLDTIQISPYRISRIVDVEGHVHVVRQDTRTEFECARQGYYVHPRSCGRFYRCVKFDQLSDEYNVFEFDCPAGLTFDDRYEVCVWPGSLSHSSACSGSSEIAPVPRERYICPSEPGYYADPENCRWFFACLDHGKSPLSAYEFRCPFGLVYDEDRLLCEWPWLVPRCGSGSAYGVAYGLGQESITVYGGGAGAVGAAGHAINLQNYDGLGVLNGVTLGGLSGPLIATEAKVYDSGFGAGVVHGQAGSGYHGNSFEAAGFNGAAVQQVRLDQASLHATAGGDGFNGVAVNGATLHGSSGEAIDQVALHGGNAFNGAAGITGSGFNNGANLVGHGSTEYHGNGGRVSLGVVENSGVLLEPKTVNYQTGYDASQSAVFGNQASHGSINSVGNAALTGSGVLLNQKAVHEHNQGLGLTNGAVSEHATVEHHGNGGRFGAFEGEAREGAFRESSQHFGSINGHLGNGAVVLTQNSGAHGNGYYNEAAQGAGLLVQSQGAAGQYNALENGKSGVVLENSRILIGQQEQNSGSYVNIVHDAPKQSGVLFSGAAVTKNGGDFAQTSSGFEGYQNAQLNNAGYAGKTTELHGNFGHQQNGQIVHQDISAQQGYENVQLNNAGFAGKSTELYGNFGHNGQVVHQDVSAQQPGIVSTFSIHGHLPQRLSGAKSFSQFQGSAVAAEFAGVSVTPISNIDIVGGGYSGVGHLNSNSEVKITHDGDNLDAVVTPTPISSFSITPSAIPTVTAVPVPSIKTAEFESYAGGVVANVPELQFKFDDNAFHSKFRNNIDYSVPRGSSGFTNVSHSFINFVSSTPATVNYVSSTPVPTTYVSSTPGAAISTGYEYSQPAVNFIESSSVRPVLLQEQKVQPAVISTYSYQKPVLTETKVQHVQPEIVQNYNLGQTHFAQDFGLRKPFGTSFNFQNTQHEQKNIDFGGYDYPKPSISFSEEPVRPIVTATVVQPQTVEKISFGQSYQQVPIQPAVVSSYNYKPVVNNVQHVQLQETVPFHQIQPVQPAVVSSYIYTKPVERTNFVQVSSPAPPRQSAVVSSYSYTKPSERTDFIQVSSSAPPLELPASVSALKQDSVFNQQQPIQSPSFSYSFQQNVKINEGYDYPKPTVAFEERPVQTYNVQRPVVTQKLGTVQPVQPVSSFYYEKSGYGYPKPAVAFNEEPIGVVNYEGRQPVQKEPIVAKKAYVTGSRVRTQSFARKPVVLFEEKQAIPIIPISSTPRYEQVSLSVNPFQEFIQPVVSSTPVYSVSYSTPRPQINFKQYNTGLFTASTPKPTLSTVSFEPQRLFTEQEFYDSRFSEAPRPFSKQPVTFVTSSQRPVISKYSFGSFDKEYQYTPSVLVSSPAPVIKAQRVVENYDAGIEVSTPKGGYLPATSASFEPNFVAYPQEIRVPVSRTKLVSGAPKTKTYVRVNDFHPFLSAKLGAQCTCVSNTLQLRKQPVVINLDADQDRNFDLEPNPLQDDGVVVGNFDEPQKIVSVTPAPQVIISSSPFPIQVGPVVRKRVRVRPVTPAYAFSENNPVPEIFLKNAAVTPVQIETERGPSKEDVEDVVRSSLKLVKSTVKEAVKEALHGHAFDRYGPGGVRSRDETLQGTVDCQRAGLFRHPDHCNKFYACRWDCTKNRYTLHVFNCPVHLTFDGNLGACNWPSQGPACLGKTILPSD